MPNISVVVPVYKVEDYLKRCVDSLLAQTYQDFELILVDDGSPDNCPGMCDEYAQKDCRIKVIHKENGGLSDARNAGIDIAKGSWLTFVDSDDYLHPDMLQVLYNAAVDNDAEISVCCHVRTRGEPLTELAVGAERKVLSPKVYYTMDSNGATSACAKLFHRGLFEAIRYPKGKLHEDAFTTYRLLFQCERIAWVNWGGYGYYTNPDSITRTGWSRRRLDLLEAIVGQIDYFTANGMTDMRRYMIREYIKCIVYQQKLAADAKNETERQLGLNALHRMGRKALWDYRKDKVITGEEDLWLYARFYPLLTKGYLLGRTLLQKLGIK